VSPSLAGKASNAFRQRGVLFAGLDKDPHDDTWFAVSADVDEVCLHRILRFV
jgi:hypothetical protein